MNCFITDMHEKEVINLCDGAKLGNVCDVEIDTCTGCLVSVIIFGRSKCFGLLGREEDIKICWDEIKVIGDDTILVRADRGAGAGGNRAGGVHPVCAGVVPFLPAGAVPHGGAAAAGVYADPRRAAFV